MKYTKLKDGKKKLNETIWNKKQINICDLIMIILQ